MHRDSGEESQDSNYKGGNWTKPRRYISSSSPDETKLYGLLSTVSGKFIGIYKNYLLVRHTQIYGFFSPAPVCEY